MDQKITALKLQKRNRNRVNVFLDGKFAFGLSRVLAARLQTGQSLNPDDIADLQDQDKQEVAYQKALRYLSYRPRSEMEVRKNLLKGNIDPVVIEDVITRLHESGLVNDEQFTQIWIDNRNRLRPRGRRLLNIELRNKGIREEIIHQSLEELDEEALALQAAEKYLKRLEMLEWPDFRRKLYGYLARRGFDYAVIKSTVHTAWETLERN